MSFSNSQLRIMNDIMSFKKNNFSDIFISVNKENTPYQYGFYFFSLKFPKDYPANPPQVSLKTIGNNVRFNPNLYQNGKVCLSILGTWNGPGWTPTMTLTSVLLSIQTLLHENPVINEPGHENTKLNSIKAQSYNKYLTFYNYSLAIYQVLTFKKFKEYKDKFENEIKNVLNTNLPKIKERIKELKNIHDKEIVKKTIYFMEDETELNYSNLAKKILKIKN